MRRPAVINSRKLNPPPKKNTQQKKPKGYTFYLSVFYTLVALLLVSTAICVWVGWCFSHDSFPFLWPIRVARVVVSVFFAMFYIAALNIFLTALQCSRGADGHWTHLVYGLGECVVGCGVFGWLGWRV